MDSDSVVPRKKVIITDLRTHEVRCIEGDDDFYGRPVGPTGIVGPETLVAVLHSEDMGTMLEGFERAALLRDGEEFEYCLRVSHADGHWVRARCRATPLERDGKGMVSIVRVEVEMTDLLD